MNAAKSNLNCVTCKGRGKSVFCDLEGASLNKLNQTKNDNLYKKGQNLFLSGNPPFGLYCVHSGKVKVTKTDFDGKETIIRIASQGDILGHRSLFSSTPYTATATVLEEGVICFVGKEVIKELIAENPSMSFKIINRLSKEMGAAEAKLASMARKSVRERFAETLLLLKESFGKSCDDEGVELDIKLTREDLASIVGAATENIIRLVTDFKEQGLIAQSGRKIRLLDVEAIEKEAALGY